MTETITALEIFEKGLTKAEIKSMAEVAVESVLEQGNPLQVAEGLTAMENFIKEVRGNNRFVDYVREENAKYPKGYTSPSGTKIELAETGVKYDFSQCNDPELVELVEVMEKAKKALDERQKFLKTVPIEGMNIITKDGEAVTVYPPSKTSTSSYKVTLK